MIIVDYTKIISPKSQIRLRNINFDCRALRIVSLPAKCICLILITEMKKCRVISYNVANCVL